MRKLLINILTLVLISFGSFLLSCQKAAIKTAPIAALSFITNITATSVSTGGEITASGGATVTDRGFCWNITQNPMISDSKTSNGSGNDSFSSSIIGLMLSVTYHLKSYGTIIIGTGYIGESRWT